MKPARAPDLAQPLTCRSRSARHGKRYRESFAAELEKFAARFRPQLILISAGFDASPRRPDWLARIGG